MTDIEKIEAFDAIAIAFTNKWHDGKWTWWNPKPCGGVYKRETQEEAVNDLIDVAKQISKKKGKLP